MLRARLRAALPTVLLAFALGTTAHAQQDFRPAQPVYATNHRALLIWDQRGVNNVEIGDLTEHVAWSPRGEKVFVSTDLTVKIVDPKKKKVVGELNLTRGMEKTRPLIQAMAVSADGKRLWIAYTFRTLESSGYVTGEPMVGGFDIDVGGTPAEKASWGGLVPDAKPVDSLFPGLRATSPVILYHDATITFTELDPRRDPFKDPDAFETFKVPGGIARRPKDVRRQRPYRVKTGDIYIPLVNQQQRGVITRFVPSSGQFADVSYRGAGSQCVAISPDGARAYLGFARLRAVDTDNGRVRASIALTPVIMDMAVSSNGRELYLMRGTELTAVNTETMRVVGTVPLTPVSLELALGSAR